MIMNQQEITNIIKSTVHIVMSEKGTLAPKGIGSGCVIRFKDKDILLTVAHVTDLDNSGTCIVTGQPVVNNTTPMYSVGAMTFLDKFDITKYEEQLKLLKTEPDRIEDIDFGTVDLSFATYSTRLSFYSRKSNLKSSKYLHPKK